MEHVFNSEQEYLDSIRGPIGPEGPRGLNGKDGKDGTDGLNGLNGKDGSPDTGVQIVNKINDLKVTPDLQIDAAHVKNIDQYVKKHSTQYTGILGIKDIIAGTNVTIDKTNQQYPIISATGSGGSVSIGDSITSATAGSVLYAGASGVLAQDNANLFYDYTNHRLGIGTTTPSNPFSVIGIDNNSATTIAGFYALNQSVGVSINYGGFNMVGSNTNIDMNFAAKGSGNTIFSANKTFFGSSGAVYSFGNSLNGDYNTNANDTLYLNYYGYQAGATQFRDTAIANGKNATVMFVKGSTGNVGIGTTSPTAALHLKAGTATADTAPLKFTSGTNLTTAVAGAMEYNGTQLFFSPSTTRNIVAQVSGATALNTGSIPFATTNGYLTEDASGLYYASSTLNVITLKITGTLQMTAMPTVDPTDGTGTLWYNNITNQVFRGT